MQRSQNNYSCTGGGGGGRSVPAMLSCSYLQEGEVAVSINAGNLQIAHDDFTVLVELLQGAVLLVQVGQSAQLVVCAGTN